MVTSLERSPRQHARERVRHAALQGRDGQWDVVDQLAAQLLLSDLALIAGTWRSLGVMAGDRLEKALAELEGAGREAERILKASRQTEVDRESGGRRQETDNR